MILEVKLSDGTIVETFDDSVRLKGVNLEYGVYDSKTGASVGDNISTVADAVLIEDPARVAYCEAE